MDKSCGFEAAQAGAQRAGRRPRRWRAGVLAIAAAVQMPLACGQSPSVLIDTVAGPGNANLGQVAMARGVDAAPLIGWVDQSNRDLKLTDCADARCQTRVTTTLFHDPRNTTTGYSERIALAPDGGVVSAFYTTDLHAQIDATAHRSKSRSSSTCPATR